MSGLADPRALLGRWRLERVVEDRRAGEHHEIEGTLEIVEAGAELRWEESLVWHRHDGDVEARRGLRLARVDGDWWVRFEDGRDFHPWAPGETVVHPCAPDTYTGAVEGTPLRWTVRWTAQGPEKDYEMTSVLTPEASPGAAPGASPR